MVSMMAVRLVVRKVVMTVDKMVAESVHWKESRLAALKVDRMADY